VRRWARAGAGAVLALCAVAALATPSQAEPAPDDRAVELKRNAGPPAGAVRAVHQSEPARITSYWTARRMRRARPLELLRDRPPRGGRASSAAPARPALHQGFNRFELADTTSFPNRTHGQVFFTLPGERDFTCSGTVVTANSHSVVLTAGHCIHDGGAGSGFATNWIFVPGYRDGSRPFGEWPAARLTSTAGWVEGANFSFDVGAAVVARNANGQGIQDVVGARGIAFNRPRDQLYRSFGYPAGRPALGFDGERAFACDSGYGGDDATTSPPQTMVIGCDMDVGASGGAWVAGGSVVSSVNSYKYVLEPDHIYGPYFGPAVESFHETVGGPPILCRGRAVTQLGGDGPDAFTGTVGPDVFLTGRGADRIVAADGQDRACAGRGPDAILAQEGEDLVSAGRGRDTVKGGPGKDECNGGRGRDRASGCERRRRFP
jgi:V8-like Glu-specific endopeptidase